MEVVMNEGAPAPVEIASVSAPEGAAPEAVKPAETPAAKPEGEEPKGVAKRIKELTDLRRAAEAREDRRTDPEWGDDVEVSLQVV